MFVGKAKTYPSEAPIHTPILKALPQSSPLFLKVLVLRFPKKYATSDTLAQILLVQCWTGTENFIKIHSFTQKYFNFFWRTDTHIRHWPSHPHTEMDNPT